MKYKSEKVVAFIFWVVGSALFLVAVLTNSWISTNQVNYGLLEWCRRRLCTSYELYYPPGHPLYTNIFLPRIILFCGAGVTAIGLIIIVLTACCKSSCPTIFNGVMDLLGGIIIWAGCILFTIYNYHSFNIEISLLNASDYPFEDGKHFHFSYFFAWISGLMYIAAGAYGINAGCRAMKFCC